MRLFHKTLLIISFLFSFTSGFAQNETEAIIQNIQTANFNNLIGNWDDQVEVNIIDQTNQKAMSPMEANNQLRNFFNKNNIIGFDKNAERKLGNTIYVTGKLIAGQNKYSLTLLLQNTKKGVVIVSVRIS